LRVLTFLDRINVEDKLLHDIFDWKAASWNRLFREILLSVEFSPTGKTVLEVGAHKGGLSLFFSLLGCSVICSDVNVESMSRAKQLHSGWGRCCSYMAMDVRTLPLRSESLDVVIMKSVLGGVYSCDGENAAIESIWEAYRVLKKGGLCILLEQLRGDPLSCWIRSRKFPARNWHYFRKEEFDQANSANLVKEFEKVKLKCLTFFSHILEQKFSPNSILVRAACIVDQMVERFVRDNWKHLIGVVAIK
jgi:ubiquinone/menaquinone biosynthesis C-methylase UbiE